MFCLCDTYVPNELNFNMQGVCERWGILKAEDISGQNMSIESNMSYTNVVGFKYTGGSMLHFYFPNNFESYQK